MKILDFALILGKLKKTKRTGWVRKNIPNPESVADHSFRVAVLTMILAPKIAADTNKATIMALIHDIGEAKIGDIDTGVNAVIKADLAEKALAERKAFKEIFGDINREEYIELFDEYENNQTKEARLVKQVDKLEMAVQALEYEQEHKINLQEFFNDTISKIHDTNIKEIVTRIMELREEKE